MTRWMPMVPMLWLLRRLAVCVVVVAGVATAPLPREVAWIGVPLGGGGARIERALEVQARHPGATLLLAGSRPELTFAATQLRGRLVGRVRYLEVEPASTWACAAALRAHAEGEGVLVTDGYHAPRLRLSWALQGGALTTPVASTGRRTAPAPWLEVAKMAAYLALPRGW